MSPWSRRTFGSTLLTLGAAGLSAKAWSTPAAATSAEGPINMSPAVERAWRNYLDALEWARRFIFTRELSDHDRVRRAANQFLMQVQAVTYYWVMAPRVDYPR
jgi:hypothetical protein